MSDQNDSLPLGKLLQNAGLISSQQLEQALEIQSQYTEMKLGEILVLQEAIKAQTVDFFIHEWQKIQAEGQQFPLGVYLKKASLLNEDRIQAILAEQKINPLKFGDLVVKKGWLERKTIDFFLNSLAFKTPQLMSSITLEEYNRKFLQLEKKYNNVSLILTRILAWTGGNSPLTKTICHVFANSDLNIPEGREIKAVDKLIEGAIIRNWRTSKLGSYLRSIEEKLIHNQQSQPVLLLAEYQNILLSNSREFNHTKEQEELLNLGIIIRDRAEEKVRITNLIFQQVFNQNWLVETQKTLESKIEKKSSKIAIVDPLENTSQNLTTDPLEITEIEPTQIENKALAIVETQENLVNKAPKTEPLTKFSSLLTLVGFALFVPLVLAINNYYSSLKQEQQLGNQTLLNSSRLENFCQNINTINPSSTLDLIFQLEQNKEAVLNANSTNFKRFPERCEIALNRLRVLAAPELGKESRVIEAIEHLCKIPANAKNISQAKIWLEHWSESSSWGNATQSYLELIDSCPARDI